MVSLWDPQLKKGLSLLWPGRAFIIPAINGTKMLHVCYSLFEFKKIFLEYFSVSAQENNQSLEKFSSTYSYTPVCSIYFSLSLEVSLLSSIYSLHKGLYCTLHSIQMFFPIFLSYFMEIFEPTQTIQ